MLFHHRNYQVVLLMLLSLVGWNRPSTPAVDCVRDQSKIVRTLIKKKVQPILFRYGVSMPEDCPFFNGHDLFGWHERHKIKMKSSPMLGWKCGICEEIFKTESALDLHFDESHSGNNDLKNKSVCLADYCDIMRCDVYKPLLVLGKDSSNDDDFILPNNQSDEPTDWKQRCSDKQQKKLQTKCTAIIKYCLSGLLIKLSIKDFQDIEDDLNNAICSYLTCKKYWEYSLLEERRVPGAFYMIIGALSTGAVCFWYYMLWIYCDGYKITCPPSGWVASQDSSKNNSLSAMRDRLNRKGRSSNLLTHNEYREFRAYRNKLYTRQRYYDFNKEFMIVPKRFHHIDKA